MFWEVFEAQSPAETTVVGISDTEKWQNLQSKLFSVSNLDIKKANSQFMFHPLIYTYQYCGHLIVLIMK